MAHLRVKADNKKLFLTSGEIIKMSALGDYYLIENSGAKWG